MEGYLRSRNIARRNGTEERPEWGASPAKPSKPLRVETRSGFLPSGMRTEFLAGGSSGFAVDLSAKLCALARFCLRDAGAQNFLRAMHRPQCGRLEEGNCADVFAISSYGPREGPGQNKVACANGLSGKARCVHSRVYADAEETELRVAQSGARAFDQLGGSDHLYSRHRPQLAGALDRAGA